MDRCASPAANWPDSKAGISWRPMRSRAATPGALPTRRDAVAPYADLHYTEMRPGSTPAVLFHPVGLYVTMRTPADARVAVHTAQGDFDFALSQTSDEVKPMLGGRATVVRVPTSEKLTTAEYEDDDPAIAALPDGGIAVAWVAYRDRAERILLREYRGGAWTADAGSDARARGYVPLLARGGWKPATCGRSGASATATRGICGRAEDILGLERGGKDRRRGHGYVSSRRGRPGRNRRRGVAEFSRRPERHLSARCAARADGRRKCASANRRPTIGSRRWPPVRMARPTWPGTPTIKRQLRYLISLVASGHTLAGASASPPARDFRRTPPWPWTARTAVGGLGRIRRELGQGPGLSDPDCRWPRRCISSARCGLAMWDGAAWLELRQQPSKAFPKTCARTAEHPQIAFDGEGTLTMLFRHWTRQQRRAPSAVPIDWENYLTRFDGAQWTAPQPLRAQPGLHRKVSSAGPRRAAAISGARG